jgi:hypothetical protein
MGEGVSLNSGLGGDMDGAHDAGSSNRSRSSCLESGAERLLMPASDLAPRHAHRGRSIWSIVIGIVVRHELGVHGGNKGFSLPGFGH